MNSLETDTVIKTMAREAGTGRAPMRLVTAMVLAAVASLVMSVALVLLIYGIQPDVEATIASGPFLHKVASMLLLACGSIFLVIAAGRPDGSPLWIAGLLPGLSLLAYGTIADQSGLPVLGRSGISAPGCVIVIVILSVPALAVNIGALRSCGVTTRPSLAGATAGLLAGALGAAAYALACKNDGGLFVAIWYSTAVTAVTFIGALVGRRWLAW
ncbi:MULTISPECIES: NrsF family protein [unclassified Rhizobium]|uniref:NrsF family protein n=1 Tax=unclassified Rhizobium TaxID=2613769 RepID=UPI001FFE081E|nr:MULTISPECIES: NrsF family protein [unclassified Rhizobium]